MILLVAFLQIGTKCFKGLGGPPSFCPARLVCNGGNKHPEWRSPAGEVHAVTTCPCDRSSQVQIKPLAREGLSPLLGNRGDIMRGLLQPSQGSRRCQWWLHKFRVGVSSAPNQRDKAPGSLRALAEGCTSDDLFAEVLYVIPYCFQVSNITAHAVITLRPCIGRNAESTWMTGERMKSNKMFYFRLLHFLIQMFLSLKDLFETVKKRFLVLTPCSPILLHFLQGFLCRHPLALGPDCHYPRFAVLLPSVVLALFTKVCAFPHLDASVLPNCSNELKNSWRIQGTQ